MTMEKWKLCVRCGRVAALRKVRRKTTLTWRTCVKKKGTGTKKNCSFDARVVSATHPPAHVCISTRGERILFGRPARLPIFFIRVTYSEFWRATVLEKLKKKITNPAHFFKSLPIHDATARRPASVDSSVPSHAPRLVQCQKIATLLSIGLASSRRATDWLWVETDTDDCAILLLLWTLWTALTINDYKCLEKKERKRFHTLTFTFPYPNNFIDHFHPFPKKTSVNAKQYRSKSRPNLIWFNLPLLTLSFNRGLLDCQNA